MAEFLSGTFGFRDLGNVEAISVDWEIYRATDSQGYPSGIPKGGIINTVLVASNNHIYNSLVKWATSPTMTYSGDFIVFDKTGAMLPILVFSDAYCIRYRFAWDVAAENKLVTAKIYLTISAGSVMFNNSTDSLIENKWPGVTNTPPSSSSSQQTGNTLDFS